MCGDGDYGALIRETSEEVAAGRLPAREAFLRVERWKTVKLMGIVVRLYSERLVLVRHIVAGEEAWTAWNGRVIVFTRERVQLNELNFDISSAQLRKRRQQEVHPLQQPRHQHPSSARREPTLVDPVAAGGGGIAGEQQQR